jgi:hypothetical protein
MCLPRHRSNCQLFKPQLTLLLGTKVAAPGIYKAHSLSAGSPQLSRVPRLRFGVPDRPRSEATPMPVMVRSVGALSSVMAVMSPSIAASFVHRDSAATTCAGVATQRYGISEASSRRRSPCDCEFYSCLSVRPYPSLSYIRPHKPPISHKNVYQCATDRSPVNYSVCGG